MKKTPVPQRFNKVRKQLAKELTGVSHVNTRFLQSLYRKHEILLPRDIRTPSALVELLVKMGLLEEQHAPYKVAYIPFSFKSIFKKALAFYENSYLSFFSAFHLHQLTLEIPKTIYVTYEQFPKNMPTRPLTQKSIDIACSKDIRRTTNFTEIEGYKIYFLNRKNSRNAGVKKIEFENEILSVTNLERTLIDAVVRPEYCGGINEVANAFRLARERTISTQRFLRTFAELNYIYPYHQAIGFLLEKTNNPNKELIEKLFEMSKSFKFYLVHNMPKEELEFNDKWNVYYPKFLPLNSLHNHSKNQIL